MNNPGKLTSKLTACVQILAITFLAACTLSTQQLNVCHPPGIRPTHTKKSLPPRRNSKITSRIQMTTSTPFRQTVVLPARWWSALA